jgi:phosphoribosylformylglycinamidine cyclo-ligase
MTNYEAAGVNLDAADELVERIGWRVTSTWTDDVVGGFGGFASGMRLPIGYENPVLMMSTDGVGTKADLARQTGLVDGLGYDLLAMVADDLAAAGATPIALTDYIAVGSLDVDLVETLIASICDACNESDVALLGGETAEHPGVMGADQFDVSATALGIVELGEEVGTSSVSVGDVIVGVKSPNLRSNGFSLVRAIARQHLPLESDFPDTTTSTAEESNPAVSPTSPAVDCLATWFACSPKATGRSSIDHRGRSHMSSTCCNVSATCPWERCSGPSTWESDSPPSSTRQT